jgi:hypothetical protein
VSPASEASRQRREASRTRAQPVPVLRVICVRGQIRERVKRVSRPLLRVEPVAPHVPTRPPGGRAMLRDRMAVLMQPS